MNTIEATDLSPLERFLTNGLRLAIANERAGNYDGEYTRWVIDPMQRDLEAIQIADQRDDEDRDFIKAMYARYCKTIITWLDWFAERDEVLAEERAECDAELQVTQ